MEGINSNDIFKNIFNNSEKYALKNASEEQIYLYKKAYKVFKEKNPNTNATISLELGTNTITLTNFAGLDMYKFGYEVAKAE